VKEKMRMETKERKMNIREEGDVKGKENKKEFA
jgi:hypothetical protein